MATTHQFMADRNPAFYIDAGNKIHEAVGLYIEQVLLRKAYPEQGYRSCQGILSFAKRFGYGRLTRACQRAHGAGYFNYSRVSCNGILTSTSWKIARGVTNARFRYKASVEQMYFEADRGLDQNQIMRLADCTFINKN